MTHLIATDYAAMIAVVTPAVTIVIAISNFFFGFPPSWRGRHIQQGDPIFLWLALFGVVFGAILLGARMRFFNTLFAAGHRVRGRVTNV